MNAVDSFSLFTTLRFTTPPLTDNQIHTAIATGSGISQASQLAQYTVQKHHVPLLDRHIARLRTAHAHYVDKEGQAKWGVWPGDDAVWQDVRMVLQSRADAGAGDYRVRPSIRLT